MSRGRMLRGDRREVGGGVGAVLLFPGGMVVYDENVDKDRADKNAAALAI